MILLRSALRNWRVWLRDSTSIYMVPEQFWVRSAIVAQYSSGTPLSQGASSFGGTVSLVQPTIPIRSGSSYHGHYGPPLANRILSLLKKHLINFILHRRSSAHPVSVKRDSISHANTPWCCVLVEHSARREPDGYDFDASHVVLEACASDTQ